MSDATVPPALPVSPVPVAAAISAGATPPSRLDFPGWVPPMLVKELRQGLRQRGFVGGLIVAQAALVIMFISGFVTDVGGNSSRGMIDGMFWAAMFVTLILLGPLRALSGLSAELDARTMDLLLLTRLDAWRIVWGKWVSLMAQTLLILVTLLPYAVVRYFFGSVDLIGDFQTIIAFLGIGAFLTGLGLWLSGLHRALRFLIIILGVIFSFSALGTIMSRHFMGFGGGFFSGMSSVGVSPWLMFFVSFWGVAVALLYCLMMAVRWFAPQAENHAIGPRLLPLALLVPPLAFALFGHNEPAAGFTFLWIFVTAAVGAIELASTREVMTVHLRGWLGRPGWRRVVGAGLLPGWPSTALWLAAMIVPMVAGWMIVDAVITEDLRSAAAPWLGMLAWAGLVFPILLVSLVPTLGRVAGVLYFSLHAILGIFAVMAGSNGLSRMAPTLMSVLDWISHAVPTTSFWHAIVELERPSELPAVELGQALGVALTLGLMLWLARPYWINVRLMREHARAASAPAKE